jgi:hypothetical protein
VGAGFYLGYSWLPSFFVKHAGVPQHMTLWMTLSGMVLYTFVVPVRARAGSTPNTLIPYQIRPYILYPTHVAWGSDCCVAAYRCLSRCMLALTYHMANLSVTCASTGS